MSQYVMTRQVCLDPIPSVPLRLVPCMRLQLPFVLQRRLHSQHVLQAMALLLQASAFVHSILSLPIGSACFKLYPVQLSVEIPLCLCQKSLLLLQGPDLR